MWPREQCPLNQGYQMTPSSWLQKWLSTFPLSWGRGKCHPVLNWTRRTRPELLLYEYLEAPLDQPNYSVLSKFATCNICMKSEVYSTVHMTTQFCSLTVGNSVINKRATKERGTRSKEFPLQSPWHVRGQKPMYLTRRRHPGPLEAYRYPILCVWT